MCKKNRLVLDLTLPAAEPGAAPTTAAIFMLLSCDFCFCQPHTHTPLPFSCCCSCCCCCRCRCHCRCPCAYCATMHNALGFPVSEVKCNSNIVHPLGETGERDAQRAFHCCRATKDLIQRSLTQGHDPLPSPFPLFPTQLTDSITQRCLVVVAVAATFNANGDNSQCKKAPLTVPPSSMSLPWSQLFMTSKKVKLPQKALSCYVLLQ